MAQPKQVVLVCTTAGIPYVEGDIFSVEESVAAILMSKDYKGFLRVRKFDAVKDAELLIEQRGKSEDVELEVPSTEK